MVKNSVHSPEKMIGEIPTWLAGMQYVRGEVRPGEDVYLERDPSNPYDSLAIRVSNLDFEDVGYIPRQINIWMAKLMDQGKILLSGYIPDRIPSSHAARSHGCPLILKVFLAEKGQSILDSTSSLTNEIEALQEAVRLLYENLEKFAHPDWMVALQKRLRPILKQDASPETHLLLNLFSSKAQDYRKTMERNLKQKIQNYLFRLQVGEAIHYRNLTVFPLIKPYGTGADYTLLKTAIDSKWAIVEEVSEQGQVNELMIHNRGDKPILLPEGEILVGAKQNRVINISLLVAAHVSLRIPVSCVERGRWRFMSRTFQPAHYAHPKLRGRKLKSVQACRMESGEAYSDQCEVWDEVSCNLKESHTQSTTESVTDGYTSSEEQIRDYRTHFDLPANAVGVLVGANHAIVGMDCFDSREAFHQCWERLSDSYFMESIGKPEERICPPEVAREFVNRVKDSIAVCDRSIGLGDELIARSPDLAGSGVWYSDSLCHLSAFRAE